MDDNRKAALDTIDDTAELTRFTESYASFNRILNSLQRKYIEVKDEFSTQNEELVRANRKLVELGERNLAATEFLNGILNSITAGVIAVDQNGRITHFNPAASMILGLTSDEVLGADYRDILDYGEPLDANALRAAETGQEVTSVEKQLGLPDGSRLHLSVSTAILRDGDGRARGAVEVFQDLTKIKRMELELARLNTLAALGEMAATVAHEVRNPLNGIAGFASLLYRDLEEADPRRKTVSKIIRGVETLNDTVETLLNYTRTEEINKTEVDIGDFLKATLDQFRSDNPERVEHVDLSLEWASTATEGSGREVSLDRVLSRQVLFNLYDNAVEAIQGEGEIAIAYRCLPRKEAVAKYADRILIGHDETVFEATVTDSGPGIPDENLEHVFAPFFSDRPGGNGLGLADKLSVDFWFLL